MKNMDNSSSVGQGGEIVEEIKGKTGWRNKRKDWLGE
jgi:hypothetical protein